jgi:methyl-accepting chemotaxis protein
VADIKFKILVDDSEIKQKLDDAKKSVEDLGDAAQDASKPLEDTAKALDDVAKAAGDVDKDLSDTSKSLDDIADSSKDISGDLGDVDKAFSDISKSAGDASSDLKDADSAFTDIADSADGSVSSMDAVKSSFEGISESAVEADQNIQAAATGLEGVGTATESAAAGSDALATSLDNVAASAQEAETNISAAATGIDGIGTSTEQATTALDGLGSAFDGAGTATTTFNDVLSSTGSSAQAASGGLTPLNTVLGDVGSNTQTASSGFQGFNTNMGTAVGFMGTAASAGLQLVSALNNIHGAQIKVDTMTRKLSTAQEAVQKAQAKLNELYASGSASAEELAQAKLDLEQATSGAAIAAGRLDKAQTDLNLKMARFGTDVLPGIVQAVTSTIAVVSQLHDKFSGMNWTDIAAGAGAVGLAIAAIGVAFKAIETAPSMSKLFEAMATGDLVKINAAWKEYRESVGGVPAVNQALGGSLDTVTQSLDKGAKTADFMAKTFPEFSTGAEGATESIQPLAAGTSTLTNEMTLSKDMVAQLTSALGNSAPAMDKLEASAVKAGAGLVDVKTPIEDIRKALDGGLASMQNYQDNVQGMIDKSEPLNAEIQKQISSLNQSADAMDRSVESGDAVTLAYAELNSSISTHNQNIAQLNATLNTAEGQQKSFENAVAAGNEAFLKWVQTSRDAAVEAETFKNNLEAMAQQFGGLPGFMEGTVEEYKAFIEANEQGGEAVDKFADMALDSWRGLVSAAEPLFNDLKEAWSDMMSGIWEEMEDPEGNVVGLLDPIKKAFDELPPAVAGTLDQIERNALSFQGKFAAVAEEAGTAWATNLQANMGQGFDQAIAKANQAAADVLAPFIQQHPETAQMFQPLFDAMNKTGPGAAQAVQKVLETLSGMPGPVGQVATDMLQRYQTQFADQLPGVTKGGTEGAVSNMEAAIVSMLSIIGNQMQTSMQELGMSIRDTMNAAMEGIIVAIKADTSEADRSVSSLQDKINNLGQGGASTVGSAVLGGAADVSAGVRAGMAGGGGGVPRIDVDTSAGITKIDELQGKIDAMGGKDVAITVNIGPAGLAITQLQGQIDGVHGSNVQITVDIGPAGLAITQLQGQIDGVHGKNVQITVDIGPAGLAITQLQGQIDGVHGKGVAITVNTGPAGIAITQLQGQINGVTGKNVAITVDIGGALAAIQQLQSAINSVQSSMAGLSAYGGGGYGSMGYGGGGTGYVGPPGYTTPYGSYRGAYAYAAGFGPAIVDRPTRMLVGEAGPEFVSVTPLKRFSIPQKTAADGMGQPMAMADPSGMEDAVRQGAQEGVAEGMQQGQGGYPVANYGTGPNGFPAGWGAGVIPWTGGAMGVGHGAGAGGGAQYPVAPSNTQLWGQPQRFTWGGGASGTSLGGGMGGGGTGGSWSSGMMPIPPNFWTGTSGTFGGGGGRDVMGNARRTGTQVGQSAATGFERNLDASGLGGEIGQAAGRAMGEGIAGMQQGAARQTGPINIGQPGYPKPYTGQVPASYGPPLGQTINGVAATILPGQGPRGPRMAQFGMHEFLKKDTLIQAHKGERVDITPPDRRQIKARTNEYVNRRLDAIMRLIAKIATQQPVTNVAFEVDGRTLSRVSARNTGNYAYGDR